MTSQVPNAQLASSTSPPGDSSGQSDAARSPLSLGLGFFKGLTEKRGPRVDGQPPKRRGPKPDSKPALTRRQELNRQAQRTHRERKELYIKALEEEVLRLKENYSSVVRDKESLAEENRQLKELLAQHGIAWDGKGGVGEYMQNSLNGDYASGTSHSGSHVLSSVEQSTSLPTVDSNGAGQSPPTVQNVKTASQPSQPGVDYEQTGIDFVLTLERPCMDHMPMLMERASKVGGIFCGHALMATCPPPAYSEKAMNIPSGHCLPPPDEGPPKKWDVSKGDLGNLFDLSKRLNLDGEITPVMAWGMLLGHPDLPKLRVEHFEKMSRDLVAKIRCYGFGAVLEEFEVRDALESVLCGTPPRGR